MAASPFRPEDFARLDEASDPLFYDMPRKVVHIDDAAIVAVKEFFLEVLPPHGVVLDLMSSWRSHWPASLPKQRLVGVGLNAVEMEENPDLLLLLASVPEMRDAMPGSWFMQATRMPPSVIAWLPGTRS